METLWLRPSIYVLFILEIFVHAALKNWYGVSFISMPVGTLKRFTLFGYLLEKSLKNYLTLIWGFKGGVFCFIGSENPDASKRRKEQYKRELELQIKEKEDQKLR